MKATSWIVLLAALWRCIIDWKMKWVGWWGYLWFIGATSIRGWGWEHRRFLKVRAHLLRRTELSGKPRVSTTETKDDIFFGTHDTPPLDFFFMNGSYRPSEPLTVYALGRAPPHLPSMLATRVPHYRYHSRLPQTRTTTDVATEAKICTVSCAELTANNDDTGSMELRIEYIRASHNPGENLPPISFDISAQLAKWIEKWMPYSGCRILFDKYPNQHNDEPRREHVVGLC